MAGEALTGNRGLGRLVALGITALGVVLVAVGLLAVGPLSLRRTHGPFEEVPAGSTVGQLAEVGQPVSYGFLNLDNKGDKPAVIDDIRVFPPPSGSFQLLGIRVAQGAGRTATALGFPPPRLAEGVDGFKPDFRSFKGFVARPVKDTELNLGVEVLVGFRLNRPGRGYIRQIQVDYHVGHRHYRARFPAAYVLCAGRAEWPDGCNSDGLDLG